MFDFISKALKAKNTLENAPLDLPGLKLPGTQASTAMDQYQNNKQGFLNSIMPQQMHDINDMKYKMRAGLASNLGMPMDTFMSNEDFNQYGMQRPKPFDQDESRMLGMLQQLYQR